MKAGTMGELILARSVIKHIRRHNKSVERGAGIGNDASCINFSDSKKHILQTEAVSEIPYIAWVKAVNNLAAAGGIPIGVRLTALLPEDISEPLIKRYMAEFNSLADAARLQIVGGHTQVGRAYLHPSFVVSMTGIYGSFIPDVKKVVPGDEIVMTKYTGLMGTDIIARARLEELKNVYAESYVRGAFFERELYSIESEARIADDEDFGIRYMHDVSHGGVYGALWQLGVATGYGIEADNSRIPVRQETIEVCEYFNINPYMLDGTGSLLMTARDGDAVVRRMNDMGINAAVIGKVTKSSERVIKTGSEKRFLTPICGDEIYKVMSDLSLISDEPSKN